MKPLAVLLLAFVFSLLIGKAFRGYYDFYLSGRIAMSAMLLFTAVAHFAFTRGMAMMLPDFMPHKTTIVFLTGGIEIAASVGLFIPNFRLIAGWLLIAFFILILPANIYAAFKHVDYQKATFDGNGLSYLWLRIPLQVFLIVWTYLAAVMGQ